MVSCLLSTNFFIFIFLSLRWWGHSALLCHQLHLGINICQINSVSLMLMEVDMPWLYHWTTLPTATCRHSYSLLKRTLKHNSWFSSSPQIMSERMSTFNVGPFNNLVSKLSNFPTSKFKEKNCHHITWSPRTAPSLRLLGTAREKSWTPNSFL